MTIKYPIARRTNSMNSPASFRQSSFPLILLLFFNFLLSGFCSAASRPGNETDKLALLQFKSQLTDDPLQVLAAWNESLHFCQWPGITCAHKHQRVTSLNLSNQKLGGRIAPQIGNLSFLHFLNLANNSFQGEIPSEFGQLYRLQELTLSNNLLEGEIPFNLSRCSKLVNLTLDHNYLYGRVPSELGSLPELVVLSLQRNNLTGTLPASIGNLSSLQTLNLIYNSFEGEIPETISQLRSLVTFGVGANNFSGAFPPSLFNLSSLALVSLAFNNFSGNIRSDIGHVLPNLQILALALNQFNGPIPASLSNSSGFQFLDIGQNYFTGNVPLSFGKLKKLYRLNLYGNVLGSNTTDDLNFVTYLTNCTQLQLLDLSLNNFGGNLPNSISNLSTQLTWLTFGMNNIGGTLPSEISNLQNLVLLDADRNLLVGKVPPSIGKLSKLQVLYLDRNQFTGEIPSSFGNITQLFDLNMEVNNFEGNIPPSLGNLGYLQSLVLDQNNLNGTIPKQIMNLSSLSKNLQLSSNFLIGSLPTEVGNLINLVILDVSKNRLSGEIPDTLRNCVALKQLFLQDNIFSGNIPSLDLLKSLEYADFSRNNFSGTIPQCLGTLSDILNLNLSFNNLEGEVPFQGVFRNSSAIDISGNTKLCGSIQELHLKPCPVKAHKKFSSLKLTFLILIPSISVALLVTFLLLNIKRKSKKKTNPQPTSSLGEFFPRISYRDLVDASSGFSSDNFIGSGHFGSVYKGTLGPDRTTVAIKVLKLQQRGASKSFMAECIALRTIRHRNLVKVLTACSATDFQQNDFKALIYQFMPNGSLENWLHPEDDDEGQMRKLNLLERMRIAKDVASALNYLHNQSEPPVIHCDIKPSNILLDNDLVAHVSDFGLSRILSESALDQLLSQFSSIGIKGTTGYAAPEYGMGSQVSKHGDVYSYGVLLLEMFTGKKPTDELFKDDFNLRSFVEMGLQNRLTEIADQNLFSEQEMQEPQIRRGGGSADNGIEPTECLRSILEIGVSCTAEFPGDRMDIKDVELRLVSIIDKFL